LLENFVSDNCFECFCLKLGAAGLRRAKATFISTTEHNGIQDQLFEIWPSQVITIHQQVEKPIKLANAAPE